MYKIVYNHVEGCCATWFYIEHKQFSTKLKYMKQLFWTAHFLWVDDEVFVECFTFLNREETWKKLSNRIQFSQAIDSVLLSQVCGKLFVGNENAFLL